MKHPTSRMLYSYWDRLRGQRCAPERSEIEPGAIRHLLADSLILELDMPHRTATLRLAGTRVCALFGRELRAAHLSALWGHASADPWRMVETVAADAIGVVAGLRGTNTDGETVDLEFLLLPLRHRARTQARALGALSPLAPPTWLGLRPLVRLNTLSLRMLARPMPDALHDGPQGDDSVLDLAGLEAGAFGALPPPANDSAPFRRGHLMVHRGGRV
ncbi:PAS domain-containing protein [Methylobacterium sp. WL120]|uniref:PAS domain-containing protein n=1 Tax=Methylobacterium sp. WL120 TaxID=2603887 RepID=UPI0011C9BC9A|nr:PAS domain-containing protein [Methylobacterium sp. WL120]TXM60436.1 PAS domain-containing protein [Methylobacterium sp. WL120]